MKTRELHIPENNPFENDKLRRAEFAQSLTNIVANYKDGFVMSLNGPWGTGKTTFLKMWEAQLKNKGYNTILFNAWENDYDNDAFLALFAEVKKNLESKLGESSINLKNLVSKANVFFKPITKAVASGLLKKAMGINIEDLTEEIAAVGSGLSDTLHKSIEEYAARKESVKDFQSLLKDCVGFGKFNTVESDKKEKVFKPLIFIIDELDRCRPNYAVEVLETIKHLFAVDGIVFVLGIDKKHLISSIKGVYGSQDIDGQEYLRRFIDLELNLTLLRSNPLLVDQFSRVHLSNLCDSNFISLSKDLFKSADSNINPRLLYRFFSKVGCLISINKTNNNIINFQFLILTYFSYFETKFFNQLYTNPDSISFKDYLKKVYHLIIGTNNSFNDSSLRNNTFIFTCLIFYKGTIDSFWDVIESEPFLYDHLAKTNVQNLKAEVSSLYKEMESTIPHYLYLDLYIRNLKHFMYLLD